LKRKPAVAGYFYPEGEAALRRTLERMVDPLARKEKAIAVVSPHAGFEYSGPVAGAVFSSVELPETYVILGPSHRGRMRATFAIVREGTWQTPLGEVPIAQDLADHILQGSELVSVDDQAHANEHSLEVQLPFIQFYRENIAFVPLCISYDAAFEELEELGRALAGAIKAAKKDVLIVASTDMSHYVSQKEAEIKDSLAIKKILELDARGLYETVQSEDISMCGFQPTTAAIVASKKLGAEKAELIRYQTSGETTGNFLEVVGYAGLRIR
jgi:hypothetical protein